MEIYRLDAIESLISWCHTEPLSAGCADFKRVTAMDPLANLFCLPLDIAFYAMTSLHEKVLK